MKITACPLCGSKNIDIGGIRDGVHPQEFLKKACKNCGWTGTPLEFDSEKDYQQFLDDLKTDDNIRNEDYFEDPAMSAPIRRHINRGLWSSALLFPALLIPLIIYAMISIIGGLPIAIGGLISILSFFGYFYFVWKKELWNKIKR